MQSPPGRIAIAQIHPFVAGAGVAGGGVGTDMTGSGVGSTGDWLSPEQAPRTNAARAIIANFIASTQTADPGDWAQAYHGRTSRYARRRRSMACRSCAAHRLASSCSSNRRPLTNSPSRRICATTPAGPYRAVRPTGCAVLHERPGHTQYSQPLLAPPLFADAFHGPSDAAFEIGHGNIMTARVTAPREQNGSSPDSALQTNGANLAASSAPPRETQPQPLIGHGTSN
jgi:hypothetical protein